MAIPYKGIRGVTLIAGSCYLAGLMWLWTLPGDEARHAMKTYVDTSLGKPLEGRLDTTFYLPDSCAPTFHAIWELMVVEPYGLCHLLGWLVKTLVLRNFWLAWMTSGAFELVELTFRHIIPSFTECWWDQVFCDFLITNLLGCLIAMWIIKRLGVRRYHWLGGTGKEFIGPFFPSGNKLFASHCLCLALSWVDFNTFTLKAALWIPIIRWCVLFRLVFWFVFGLQAADEFYNYWNEQPKWFPMPSTILLAVSLLLAESALFLKFDMAKFLAPYPKYVQQGLLVGGVLLATYYSVIVARWFLYPHKAQKAQKPKRH